MRFKSIPGVFLLTVLAGCGGGGGGGASSGGGGGVPPTIAPATASPIPTASPTPTPTATPATASGTLLDLGSQRYAGDGNAAGSAISGATVIVGPTLVVGSTAPPSTPTGDAGSTTDVSGNFAVSGYSPTGTTYVMIFPKAGDPHISSHALANINAGKVRTLYSLVPSSDDSTILALVNSDRAANGASPVVFDEIAMEAARAHVDFMAKNGYYQHCIPAANCAVNVGAPTTAPGTFAAMFASPDDIYNALAGANTQPVGINATENFGTAFLGTWAGIEGVFMAEKSVNGGHYSNIVNTSRRWAGFGRNQNGIVPPGVNAPSPVDTYVQEFYSPTGV